MTLKYNRATSVISAVIHKAVNLQNTTHVSLPNPYLKLYLVEQSFSTNTRDVHSKKKTKTKSHTVNPVFEETLEYFIPWHQLRHQKLEVGGLLHSLVVN